jgi:hypothetical protein
MYIDPQSAVSKLHRLQSQALKTASRPKVPLNYEILDVLQDSAGRTRSFTVRYHTPDWTAICDLDGIRFGDEQVRRWADISNPPHVDTADLQRFLYHDRDRLVNVQLGSSGGWNNVRAPGWFVLQLYEVLR